LDDLKTHDLPQIDIKDNPDLRMLKDWARSNRVHLVVRQG